MYKKAIFLTIISIVLACATLPPNVNVFYMGENQLQYFFPGRWWVSPQKEYKLNADWLYRNYSIDGKESPRTILNFTLYSTDKTFNAIPTLILLQAGSFEYIIPSEQIRIIYIDQGKTRYSLWLPSAQMRQFMAKAMGGADILIQFKEEYHFSFSSEFRPHVTYFKDVILGSEL